MNRSIVRLCASGKFVDLNKMSYEAEKHLAFVEGALYCYDLMRSKDWVCAAPQESIIVRPSELKSVADIEDTHVKLED